MAIDKPSDESAADRDTIERLAESFVERYRAGEQPSIDEYAARYPEQASQLRELLSALILLEKNASVDGTEALQSDARSRQPAPTQIGEYRIVREIGRGGMGVVYEAIQQSLGRHVALKVLWAPSILSPLHLERFRFEARAAARLHHTHIVPVFGVGECEGHYYYAMQFIQGQSLDLVIDALREMRRAQRVGTTIPPAGNPQTVVIAGNLVTGEYYADGGQSAADFSLNREPESNLIAGGNGAAVVSPVSSPSHSSVPLAESTSFATSHGGREYYRSVARVGLEVAEALAYAHSEGILHRDIKPSNLLLDGKGSVWITDFGLAKAEGTEGLTQTGDFVGTLRYMAPERLEGWSDRRSDVYSLGATLYEVLTLTAFLESSSRGKLIDRIRHDYPPAPSTVDTSVPRDLETIVLKAIAKDPAARYHKADDLAEDLRRYLGDRPILARRATATERLTRWCRRNPVVATLSAALALLLVAATVVSTSLAVLAQQRNKELNDAIVREHEQRATAEKNFGIAQKAVDNLLVKIARDERLNRPGFETLRAELLGSALPFLEQFADQQQMDATEVVKRAKLYDQLGGMLQTPGQWNEAVKLREHAISTLTSLVKSAPGNFEAREMLARSEGRLGSNLLQRTDAPDPKRGEMHLRRAVALYDDLRRDAPDRQQADVGCLHRLAELLLQEGKRSEALPLLRRAIENGELYVEQTPKDRDAESHICWASNTLANALIAGGDQPSAEKVLNGGLRHAEAVVAVSPNFTEGLQVDVVMRLDLAILYSNTKRADAAIALLERAVRESQTIGSGSSDEYTWSLMQDSQSRLIKLLHDASRDDEAKASAQRCIQWLKTTGSTAANQPERQKLLSQSATKLLTALRSIDMNDLADDFEATAADAHIKLPPKERNQASQTVGGNVEQNNAASPEKIVSEPDLIGYWCFDEGEGTTARDRSGHNQDGVLIGTNTDNRWSTEIPATPDNRGSLRLDGIDQHVSVPDNDLLEFSDPMTISVWINTARLSPSWDRILEKNQRDGGYAITLEKGTGRAVFRAPGGSVFSKSPVNDGHWHHLVCVCNNRELRIYVDGELGEVKSDINLKAKNNDAPLLIGVRPPNVDAQSPQPFRGLIDELRIYRRALSEAEIRQLGLAPEKAS